MRKCGLFLLALLLLLTPAACHGTLEVGIEHTPTPTPDLGKLAYVQGGDIWVKALPDGEPQRLTTDGRNREPRWSPSGEWLAFRKGDYQVWLMRGDGSEAYALNEGRTVGAFAWMPGKDRLAYVWGEKDLQAVNADGTDQAVLVPQNPSERIGPIAWSPDGAWIAYEWREQGPKQPVTSQGLRKVSTDGGRQIELYTSGAPEKGEALLAGWSGDGRFLLFWQGDILSASMLADGVPLYALPAEGGTPVRLDEAVLFYSDFVAPRPAGGRQVAVITGAYRAAWTRKTLRIVLPASGEGEAIAPPTQAASSPAWSPDGQHIAYVAMPDQGDLVGGEPARQGLMQRRLWVASIDGEHQAQQVTDDPAYRDERPLWSADGNHILFARLNTGNQASLWLIPVKGGEPLQVVKELTPAPEWFGYYGHIDWDDLFDWWRGPAVQQVQSETTAIVPIPTPTMTAPKSGLLYLKEETVCLLGESGEQPIGLLPEDAGHLALGPRYLAYIVANRIQALSLAEGTTHTLFEFSDRMGQDFDLRWSTDGSTLAYVVAWDEPDGSRMVELGTTDGYLQKVLDRQVTRTAGLTLTPPPVPPITPEPGFANLTVLGFDQLAGRLAVTQAGGEERYSAVWFYDSRTGQRVETLPVNVEAQAMALSPNLLQLAVAMPGTLQIWPLGTDAPPRVVELPSDTHSTWLPWSPDSQRLAYLLNEGAAPTLDASPNLGLWIWEGENGQARQLLLTFSPEATLHGWTADGKAVVLETLDSISRQRTVSLVDIATEQVKSFSLPEGSRVLGWIGDSNPAMLTFTPELTASSLMVEEYPIVAQEVDTPGHLEYFQRIPSEVLERRRSWREPSAEKFVEPYNAALAPFGYRLVLKRKPGWDHPFYDLYQEESLLKSDLDAIWPVSVSGTGDDFALLVEELNGPTFLVRREAIEKWDQDRHCYIPPIFVGDDLVAVEVDEQHERYVIRQEGKMAYNFTALVAPGPRADNPVKGLWSWDGRWVLEVDGQVIMGGQNLNQELGYAEIFGWRLLKGQPFYFFRKDNHIGISYAGQALSYQYDEVIHYRCCEPAAFNVFGNETMAWFHALRDGMWYYVEMGIYGEDQG